MAQRIFDRRIVITIILLVIILLVDAGLTLRHIRQLYVDTGWVLQSYKVIQTLDGVLAKVTEAETNQRGYLITGEPAYLDPYQTSLAQLNDNILQLERLTAYNPEQQKRLPALKVALNHRLRILHDNLVLRTDKGFNAIRKGELLSKGNLEMERIRDLVVEFVANENALLESRLHRSQYVYYHTLWSCAVLSLLCLMMIGALIFVGRRYMTARDKSAHQLYEEREIFRTTLASIGDAVITTDTAGRVVYLNGVAQTLTGWTQHEAQGRPLEQVFNIVNEHTRKPVENPVAKVLSEGHIIGLANHTILLSKNGNQTPVEDSAAPIRDKDGQLKGVVLIFRDVTESRRAQEELRQSELRYRHLAENLAKSNRELEQFAYVASHDLQEPLHVIRSFIGLLNLRCEKKLDGKEKEYLEYILQAGAQAQTLVKNLLEYSRLGKNSVIEIVDLKRVIEEVKLHLRFAMEDSRAKISYDELPNVKANHLEIVQLFQNLISNAIKYAKAGEPPQIDISWSLLNNMYLFAVKDNGIGIEAQYKERIFEMFQRLHSKTESSGTGIGLAICKKIVEQHGGKIWMESEPGCGSVFYFTLKAAV